MRRLGLVLVIVSLIAPTAFGLAAPGRDEPSEVSALIEAERGDQVDTVVLCADHGSDRDVYRVRDQASGTTYSVTILESSLTRKVRVVFNNQIPTTFDSTTIIMWSGGKRVAKFTDVAISGGCGILMGTPAGTYYSIQVSFGGLEVVVTHSASRQYSLTVDTVVENAFDIGIGTQVGTSSVRVAYGSSGSVTTSEGFTVTYKGIRKVYGQQYGPEHLMTLTPLPDQ